VSEKSDRLVDRITTLVECSGRLRDLLSRYEEANVALAAHLSGGQSAMTALDNLETTVRRREVTETLEEFDAARHEVRLALLATWLDEGGSRSSVGRALGISRQLASRLAAEVERREPGI
jgi:hypothetical protein